MLVAAGAVLGVLTGAAGPVARSWANKKGHTGSLKSLLLQARSGNTTPQKVEVVVFPPKAKEGPAAAVAQARPAAAGLAATLKAQAGTAATSNTRGGAYTPEAAAAARQQDSQVIRIAVPAGPQPQIFRAAWDEA